MATTQIDLDSDWAPVGARWVEWIDGNAGGRTRLWNLDGIPWWEAPIPRRWHRCSAQTYGLIDWFTIVLRCRCGAIHAGGRGGWLHRNSRERA